MNIDNNLILIKGEDKTASIESWRFDQYKPVVFITFISKYGHRKEYPYNTVHVQFLKNPKIIFADNNAILKDNVLLFGVKQLQIFGRYCRIVYKTGHRELTLTSSIRVVKSALDAPENKKRFEYLKQIAMSTSLVIDGRNILEKHYEKIDYIREDSILGVFLSGKYEKEAAEKNTSIIYPFGFNLSQKQAVDNALCNPISIIEGPPGTGKTQTILNIIANAVMRGESVAVVSSNNSATANVLEKLKKYGVDFIAAPLGSSANKEAFIESQNLNLPDMCTWKDISIDVSKMRQDEADLDKMLKIQNELSKIKLEQDSLNKEYNYFSDYYKSLNIHGDIPYFSKRIASSKILAFLAEYELLVSENKQIGFFKRIVLKLTYGLKNFSFYGQSIDVFASHCQNLYYIKRLDELEKRKLELEKKLASFDFDSKMKLYSEMSMNMFKSKLAEKYGTSCKRRYFESVDLWKDSEEFIDNYPVVLSTTYSLRASLSNKFVYDYVIVDEASQVDLATGALALSCAKKTVVVGDLKQLPNVVDSEQREITDRIFENYDIPEAYRYSENSLLSSLTALFPNAPHVLLKEHYRCHPEIIGFCNQRFYNNELIILTKKKEGVKPLMVYRTVPGNHARGHVNQRQIDVILNEVFPKLTLDRYDGSVGIVTPYRNQANELQKVFVDTTVKADTADKFQGQERKVMIFSTVDNEISDFASNPNRLNVAVSRAVEQFIVVTDGNDNDKSSPIYDLIGYIQYQNYDIINSEIHSVFDYLYRGSTVMRNNILHKYGKVSDVDSENLMYAVIRDVLKTDEFSKYDVVMHVPLRMILSDLTKLNTRELSFATNHLTHVDFLIFSRLTHMPVLVVEVDGFAYHNNDKQRERDQVKNTILEKYSIPMLRLSTVGSREKEKLICALENVT